MGDRDENRPDRAAPPRGWAQTPWASRDGARLLEVRSLDVEYGPNGACALSEIELSVARGGRLGIIGASGAGKTTLLRAVMGLLPPNAVPRGSVRVGGIEVVGTSEAALRELRGKVVAMVFEHPARALNPTMRVDRHVAESLRAHRRVRRALVRRDVESLLEQVGLGAAFGRRFPHELSEPERQRVLLAGALAGAPELLLVDEGAAAISPDTRRRFFALLAELQADAGFALVLVSHETAPLFALCDEVVVLSAGRILEQTTPIELATRPRVPYCAALVSAGRVPPEPSTQARVAEPRVRSLAGPFGVWRTPLRGQVSGASGVRVRVAPPLGCAHAATCARASARCAEAVPPLKEYEYGHRWACWNPMP